MDAKLCDQCKKVIEGEVKTEMQLKDKTGALTVTLSDADWCQGCANRAMAALCQGSWAGVKQKRKPKPEKVAA